MKINNQSEEAIERLSRKESMKEHMYNTNISNNYPELDPRTGSWGWERAHMRKYRNRGCYNGKKPKWRKYRKEQRNFKAKEKKEMLDALMEAKKYE